MDEDAPSLRSGDVRYAPRAVEDEEWLRSFLREHPAGVLGLVDEDSPYVVPQLFAYAEDADSVLFHGARDGRTRRIVEGDGSGDAAGVEACLAVQEMGRIIAAEHPVDFDVEYASVVVFGRVRLVEGEDAKRRALERFMARFAPHLDPGEDYEPVRSASIDRTSVYRLDVNGWSGKRNATDPEDPMAFSLDDVRPPE